MDSTRAGLGNTEATDPVALPAEAAVIVTESAVQVVTRIARSTASTETAAQAQEWRAALEMTAIEDPAGAARMLCHHLQPVESRAMRVRAEEEECPRKAVLRGLKNVVRIEGVSEEARKAGR